MIVYNIAISFTYVIYEKGPNGIAQIRALPQVTQLLYECIVDNLLPTHFFACLSQYIDVDCDFGHEVHIFA